MTSLIACTLFCSSVFLHQGIVSYNKLRASKNSKNQKKPKHILENEKELFQKTFCTENTDKEDSISYKYNTNIDNSLYDYKTHENHNSELFGRFEKEWSTRILFQNTTYGNIIMYYDLFRQAFAYYSDVQVNYSLLNLVAMKYVRIYLCRDFFVDNQVGLPDDYTNPFNQMKEDETEREKKKKQEKRVKMKLNLDSSVFVKKKQNKMDDTRKQIQQSQTQEKTDKPIYKNNFRFLGKLNNFSFIQPISIKKLKAAAMESKLSSITDHYDYVTFKDTITNSPLHGTNSDSKTESSPFYKKFEELLI